MQILRRMRSSGIGLTILFSLSLGLALVLNRANSEDGDIQQAAAQAPAKHPLDPAIRLAKISRAALDNVEDYSASFAQKERVGNKLFTHSMMVKHRRQPFSVYMKYVGQHKGREVIYVEGQNDGKLLAHDTGLGRVVGTIALAPTSSKAMSESIYPITDFGMLKLVDRVIAEWVAETKFDDVQVAYTPSVRLGKAECKLVETTHEQPRSNRRHYRTRLYIEKKTSFPVRVEHFGFPEEAGEDPPLIAEYQYSDILVNQSLTNSDFDTANSSYEFK